MISWLIKIKPFQSHTFCTRINNVNYAQWQTKDIQTTNRRIKRVLSCEWLSVLKLKDIFFCVAILGSNNNISDYLNLSCNFLLLRSSSLLDRFSGYKYFKFPIQKVSCFFVAVVFFHFPKTFKTTCTLSIRRHNKTSCFAQWTILTSQRAPKHFSLWTIIPLTFRLQLPVFSDRRIDLNHKRTKMSKTAETRR